MQAIIDADTDVLNRIADNSSPANWAVRYQNLIDAGKYDEAFDFWKARFPTGNPFFLWDTVMQVTNKSRFVAEQPGYPAFLAHYGITPQWKNFLCKKLIDAEAITGITPVCQVVNL